MSSGMTLGETILKMIVLLGVGALTGLFVVKVLKKPILGNVWGGVVIGIIGSVLGGFFLDRIIMMLKFLLTNKINVNFVASTLGALIVLWIFYKISKQHEY